MSHNATHISKQQHLNSPLFISHIQHYIHTLIHTQAQICKHTSKLQNDTDENEIWYENMVLLDHSLTRASTHIYTHSWLEDVGLMAPHGGDCKYEWWKCVLLREDVKFCVSYVSEYIFLWKSLWEYYREIRSVRAKCVCVRVCDSGLCQLQHRVSTDVLLLSSFKVHCACLHNYTPAHTHIHTHTHTCARIHTYKHTHTRIITLAVGTLNTIASLVRGERCFCPHWLDRSVCTRKSRLFYVVP